MQGLEKIRPALRVNPHRRYNYSFQPGQACLILGLYPEAIDAFNSELDGNLSSERLRVSLGAACPKTGRLYDAGWEAEQAPTLNPAFTVARIANAFPLASPGDRENVLSGLRTGGFD